MGGGVITAEPLKMGLNSLVQKLSWGHLWRDNTQARWPSLRGEWERQSPGTHRQALRSCEVLSEFLHWIISAVSPGKSSRYTHRTDQGSKSTQTRAVGCPRPANGRISLRGLGSFPSIPGMVKQLRKSTSPILAFYGNIKMIVIQH